MDDSTLDGLLSALQAQPGNAALLRLVLPALLDRTDPKTAADLLGAAALAAMASREDRVLTAEVFRAAGDAERALQRLPEDPPLALHVHLLLDLGRRDEAVRIYRAAVAANPTLEDSDLTARLGAREREVAGPGGSKLRVIANDDTDATEAMRLTLPPEPAIDFSHVGGLDDVKHQIRKRIVLPFEKPTLFQRFRKRVGGGILLYGPPGCGKTLLARATAGECRAQFLSVAISDVLDMYIGESERKLHALFDKARQSRPAVLFFDELEALAGRRQYTREASSSKLVSQFLSEMDGFQQSANQGLLVLAATNVPWAIDPAFRRPGRFDRTLFVPPPDEPARASILRILLQDRPGAPEIDVDAVARRSSGFSGADLGAVVEAAADRAIARSLNTGTESALRNEDFRDALSEVKPTAMEWLTTARNYARYANEAGQYDEVLAFLREHGRA